MKKIVFFVPALSQPRCIKRIHNIHHIGNECYVYGYNRKKYDVNLYPSGIEVEILGDINDGDYLRKFITVWKDSSRIIDKYNQTNTIFYAFGFIHALVCLVKRVKYIYEISDILYAYPKFRIIQPLLLIIDRIMIRRSLSTVMTSGGFRDYIGVKADNIMIVANKVNSILEKSERKVLNLCSNHIRFAFVGSMRYETIFKFSEVVGQFYPEHSFTFYGGATGETKERIESIASRYNNVYYHGVYKNPDDLVTIYNNKDVVVACYDIHSENERIAEPNKLYEALFFCKPILVSPNIYLSKRVDIFKCGYTIDASTENSIRSFISNLSTDELNVISKREYLTPISEMVDNPEELNELFRPK